MGGLANLKIILAEKHRALNRWQPKHWEREKTPPDRINVFLSISTTKTQHLKVNFDSNYVGNRALKQQN